jgi:hypothetical protein
MGKYPPIDPDSLTREDLVRLIDFTLLEPDETLVAYARFDCGWSLPDRHRYRARTRGGFSP